MTFLGVGQNIETSGPKSFWKARKETKEKKHALSRYLRPVYRIAHPPYSKSSLTVLQILPKINNNHFQNLQL